jgi:hypothetical protein
MEFEIKLDAKIIYFDGDSAQQQNKISFKIIMAVEKAFANPTLLATLGTFKIRKLSTESSKYFITNYNQINPQDA